MLWIELCAPVAIGPRVANMPRFATHSSLPVDREICKRSANLCAELSCARNERASQQIRIERALHALSIAREQLQVLLRDGCCLKRLLRPSGICGPGEQLPLAIFCRTALPQAGTSSH